MNDGIDFLSLARKRYSVRQFTEEPVRQADLDRILQAGIVAPTACNLQPWHVYVIQSPEAVAKLADCTRCHFGCKTALLVCQDQEASWQRGYDGKRSGEIDAAIVTTHMMLEAEAIGVGATWVMHFRPAAVRECYQLPEREEPVALLVLGYPAKEAQPNPRHSEFRPEAELVTVL